VFTTYFLCSGEKRICSISTGGDLKTYHDLYNLQENSGV
jgi:hypothetical protein